MICDTSALINAHIVGQLYHDECLAALNEAHSLVLSPLVLAEIDYLLSNRHSSQISHRILRGLSEPEFEIARFESADIDPSLAVMSEYEDLNVGLTDASLVVLAKRYNTDEILTLDQRHFRAMRSLSGRPFKILPFDTD